MPALFVVVVFKNATVNGAEPEIAPPALDDKLDVTVNPAVTVGAVRFRDCVVEPVTPVETAVPFKVTEKLLPVVVYVFVGLKSVLVVPSPNVHNQFTVPTGCVLGLEELENKNVAGTDAVVVETKKLMVMVGLYHEGNG